MVGDLSPLAIEAPAGGRRSVPPALVVALAVGLGTVDMPVPDVVEWEWLNWKFPRALHAGDTIYARWTLTQKRPPVGEAASSIVVWRVDVHTADGALCAEGEVGAKVKRVGAAPRQEVPAGAPAAAPRRRRRRSRANGTPAEPPPVAASQAPEAKPARTSGGSRRRRRRRPASSATREEEREAPAAQAQPAASVPTGSTATAAAANRRGLTGVLRRLRGT